MRVLEVSCFLFVAFLVTVNCFTTVEVTETEWSEYKATHNKLYDEFEDVFRRSLFLKSKQLVERHNKLYEEGKSSYFMGVNQFSDMTKEELSAMFPKNMFVNSSVCDVPAFVPSPNDPKIDSKDWRKEGAVTEVKNQGQCGSCWTFSVTGTIEGQTKIKNGQLKSLSEKQLLDCDTNAQGCGGGWPCLTLDYVQKAGGIETEEDYPYEPKQGKCQFNPQKVAMKISGRKMVSNNEAALQQAVSSIGPISVVIKAQLDSFFQYKGGIYEDPQCQVDCDHLDHAVLAVGFGKDQKGKEYWIVKNSWGATWGDQGYMLMARNKGNMCGITCYATYPTV